MGIIRFILAVSVVLGHSSPILGYFGIPAHAAVTLFFIISGFYMGLIATEKYTGINRFKAFYSNRFLRLYPTYLIAVFIALAVRYCFVQIEMKGSGSFFPSQMSWFARLFLVIPNISLFGSDWVYFFHFGPDSGWHFSLGGNAPGVDTVRASRYLLIPPAWSVGLELWFYLLVPFLVQWRTIFVVGVAVISFGIQQGMEASIAWSSYFFFPANFGYFLIGVLGYRFYRTDLFRRYATEKNVNVIFFAVLANLILRQYIPYYRNYPWQMYLMFSLSLPFLFQASKNSLWDRWIGNLSYPIYIIHHPIIKCLEQQGTIKDGLLTLSLTLVTSIIVLVFVDQPLDRIRQRRIEKVNAFST